MYSDVLYKTLHTPVCSVNLLPKIKEAYIFYYELILTEQISLHMRIHLLYLDSTRTTTKNAEMYVISIMSSQILKYRTNSV